MRNRGLKDCCVKSVTLALIPCSYWERGWESLRILIRLTLLLRVSLLASALIQAPVGAYAQFGAWGTEFQVNTTTSSDQLTEQYCARVAAMAPDGKYVI